MRGKGLLAAVAPLCFVFFLSWRRRRGDVRKSVLRPLPPRSGVGENTHLAFALLTGIIVPVVPIVIASLFATHRATRGWQTLSSARRLASVGVKQPSHLSAMYFFIWRKQKRALPFIVSDSAVYVLVGPTRTADDQLAHDILFYMHTSPQRTTIC